jgi:hypothetical protein
MPVRLSFDKQAIKMKTPLTVTALLFLSLAVQSQPGHIYHDTPYLSPGEIFLECADALPRLYARGDFDSIAIHLQRRMEANPAFQTDVYALRVLLAIQQRRFTPELVRDANLYSALDDYVRDAAASQSETGFTGMYPLFGTDIDPRPYYGEEFSTLARWAEDLIEKRRLSNGEFFLCQAFAGDFEHPRKTARRDRVRYWQMNEMLDASFASKRKAPTFNLYFGTGVWIPNGHLARFGVHPSITALSAGKRTGIAEWDFTMALRFVPTPEPYTVLRQDSLYSVHNFFGGYIGLDYARYIVQSRRFEMGPLAGVGFDGFDVNDGYSDSHPTGPPAPFSINSLNLNGGWRINYFFDPNHYIGVLGRYNLIWYSNPGGTPLDGNAVSIDLIVGFN